MAARKVLKDTSKVVIVNDQGAKKNTVNASYKALFVQICVNVKIVKTVNTNLTLLICHKSAVKKLS
jgi:hypothetical protein